VETEGGRSCGTKWRAKTSTTCSFDLSCKAIASEIAKDMERTFFMNWREVGIENELAQICSVV